MSEGAWRFGIAMLVVAAVSFYGGTRCAGRPDAAAIARADSLAAVLANLEEVHNGSVILDSARADSLRASEAALADLRARVPVVRLRVDTLVERVAILDTALADSLRTAVATERALADSAAEAHTAIVLLWRDRWKTAAAERDSYRDVALELNRQLAAAVRRPARRSLVRDVALAAGGYLLGKAL